MNRAIQYVAIFALFGLFFMCDAIGLPGKQNPKECPPRAAITCALAATQRCDDKTPCLDNEVCCWSNTGAVQVCCVKNAKKCTPRTSTSTTPSTG